MRSPELTEDYLRRLRVMLLTRMTAEQQDEVLRAAPLLVEALMAPIEMVLFCPRCGEKHIDAPDPAVNWQNPPHRSHECRACKNVWRPADVHTTGVSKIETRGKRDTWPEVK